MTTELARPDAQAFLDEVADGAFELATFEQHWAPEVKRLLEDYFTNRPVAFTQQLRAARLFFE